MNEFKGSWEAFQWCRENAGDAPASVIAHGSRYEWQIARTTCGTYRSLTQYGAYGDE